jgi:hypothetical protein
MNGGLNAVTDTMKAKISAALVVATLECAAGAAAQSGAPTLSVLYTYQREGGTPTAITEVGPLKFLGINSTSPGIFSVTGAGRYKALYCFPDNPQMPVGAYGPLTPALNSSTYATAVNSGPKPGSR